MTVWALYIGLGACAGLLAGLFGIGGGIIIVPALIYAFTLQHVSPAVLTHMAVGTSLASIIFTSLNSLHEHHRRRAVDWSIVWLVAPGLLLGGWLGAGIAHFLKGPLLQNIFGVFALAIALHMAFGRATTGHRSLPGPIGNTLAGVAIGSASGIFGVGGGSLLVPYFNAFGIVMQRAVATSAGCGLFIALAGGMGFLYNGWGAAGLPEKSVGYLYLPALLGISLASMPFSRLGARLAHRMPAAKLKRLFALLLALVGLSLVLA